MYGIESWNLIKIRHIAKLTLKFVVGYESHISLQHDNWHLEILFAKYGHRVIYDSTNSLDALVSSNLKNEDWCWRPARSKDLVSIQSRISLVLFVGWGVVGRRSSSMQYFKIWSGSSFQRMHLDASWTSRTVWLLETDWSDGDTKVSHAVFFAKPMLRVGLFFECSFTKKTLKGDYGLVPEFSWEDLVC